MPDRWPAGQPGLFDDIEAARVAASAVGAGGAKAAASKAAGGFRTSDLFYNRGMARGAGRGLARKLPKIVGKKLLTRGGAALAGLAGGPVLGALGIGYGAYEILDALGVFGEEGPSEEDYLYGEDAYKQALDAQLALSSLERSVGNERGLLDFVDELMPQSEIAQILAEEDAAAKYVGRPSLEELSYQRQRDVSSLMAAAAQMGLL